jgi:hypothetical protein
MHYLSLYPIKTIESVLSDQRDSQVAKKYGIGHTAVYMKRKGFIRDWNYTEEARKLSPREPLLVCLKCSCRMQSLEGHRATICPRCGWKDDCC